MGTIFGTCGHVLTDKEFLNNAIAVKEYDGGGRVICCMVVCNKCLKWWRKKKLILHNEKEEGEWLNESSKLG